MIVTRILVWLVSLPLVLTLGIWIQVPFLLSLKVPFSASSSITPSITQFQGSSQFLDKIFRPKNCVIEARETYIKSLYATQLDIRTPAADLLIKEINTWIMEMPTYTMRVRTSPRSRKATVLMVKHRAANLTYCCTLTRFGHNPSMDTNIPWYLSESGPVLVPERQLCSWLNTGPLTSPTVVH